MPYANNQGVRVYYEVEGQGPPLVLAHSLTRNLNAWRSFGYTASLRNDFQLILFDARGHGRSDKPHDARAYGAKMADDVIAVLNDIGLSKAHYLSYSMGAMIGFRVAAGYATRFDSFVLGGTSPYVFPGAMVKAFRDGLEEFKVLFASPEEYVLRRKQILGRSLTSEEKDTIAAWDAEALIAVMSSLLDMPPLTPTDLSRISSRCLVYAGELDPFFSGAKESINHMPRAKFISLPGLGHSPALLESDIALPHVKEFLTQVSKTQGCTHRSKKEVILMDVIKTDAGYISGTVLGEPDRAVYVFRGIPYAAPPVGDLRWKPPQPVTPWPGIRECTAFSKAAPQSRLDWPIPAERAAQSEDCLYLNVLTTAKDASERLPVMVGIHGGNYSVGSGNDSLYNGIRLPLNGVVLVNLNFRLGPFGFLAHPLLSRESTEKVSGNYGYLDIITALKWVQRNISAFGGDPENVTVFGQSSGGATVACLMASPLAKGLFHRAIGESTGPARGNALAETEARGEKVFAALGVDKEEDSLAAARTLPWEKVIEAGQTVNAELKAPWGMWNAAVDGWFLPDSSPNVFETGRQNVVPFIMGGNDAREFAAMGLVAAYTNRCAGANRVGGKGYIYAFDHVPAGWKKDGVFSAHAMEIPYVFGRWDDSGSSWAAYVLGYARRVGAKSDDPGTTDVDRSISEMMMKMWTNFARTGNPSIPGVVDWPAWDEAKDQYLYITESPEVRSGFSKIAQK